MPLSWLVLAQLHVRVLDQRLRGVARHRAGALELVQDGEEDVERDGDELVHCFLQYPSPASLYLSLSTSGPTTSFSATSSSASRHQISTAYRVSLDRGGVTMIRCHARLRS